MKRFILTLSILYSTQSLASPVSQLLIDGSPSPLASVSLIQKASQADLSQYLKTVKKKIKSLSKKTQREILGLETQTPECETEGKKSCNLVFSSVLRCVKKKKNCPMDLNTESLFNQSPYARVVWVAHWQSLRANIAKICKQSEKNLKVCTSLAQTSLSIQ